MRYLFNILILTFALNAQTMLYPDRIAYFDGGGAAEYGCSREDLVVEAGDVGQSENNATVTTIGMTMPAYADDDLVIVNIGFWQDNTDNTYVTWPAGPNSETVTNITTGYGPSGDDDMPQIAFGWFLADGAYVGGTWNITVSEETRWDGVIIIVPDGEFDADVPISTAFDADSATSGTSPDFDAFSATSDDAGGKLVAFISVDQDPISGTPTGWTDLANDDAGRASIVLSVRDANVTSEESICASGGWTIGGDPWSVWAYIVRSYCEPCSSLAVPTNASTFTISGTASHSKKDTIKVQWRGFSSTDSIVNYDLRYKYLSYPSSHTDGTSLSSGVIGDSANFNDDYFRIDVDDDTTVYVAGFTDNCFGWQGTGNRDTTIVDSTASACESGNEYLEPTSDVTSVFTCGTGTDRYALVDEGYASASSTWPDVIYFEYNANPLTETFGIGNTSSMGASCTTDSIVVFIYAYDAESGTPGSLEAQIDIGGSTETSAEGNQSVTGSSVWYSFRFAGTWTKTQVDAMEIDVIGTGNSESNSTFIGTLTARVYYD